MHNTANRAHAHAASMSPPALDGGGGHPTPASASASADYPPTQHWAEIQTADDCLGRVGGLTAAGVFAAVGEAAKVVGFFVDDPKLHVKSGFRGLIPLHLRVSARIHQVAFFHPSLDPDVARLAGGGKGPSSPSSPLSSSPSSSRDRKGLLKNLDMAYVYGSDYAAGRGGGEGGGGGGGGGSNLLETLILEEKRRLSRDGIVKDHLRRKRRAARMLPKSKASKHDTASQVKGRRTFVMLSADEAAEGKSHKKAAFLGRSKKSGGRPTSPKRGDSFDADKLSARKLEPSAAVTDQTVVFDEAGITGDGPVLASVIMDSPVAKIGRYLPETACRVPQYSVGFELARDHKTVKSTQPFVPEAPHTIWGGARDAPLKMVAMDGNALVQPRDLEYLTDAELELAERTESLLVIGSTVWVDMPPEIKKDVKTAKDYAKEMEMAAKKGGVKVKKGLAKGATATADVTSKGAKNIGKGATATAEAMVKGVKAIGKAATDVAHAGATGIATVGEKIGVVDKDAHSVVSLEEGGSASIHGDAGVSVDHSQNESIDQDDDKGEDTAQRDGVSRKESIKPRRTRRKEGKKFKKFISKTVRVMKFKKKVDNGTRRLGISVKASHISDSKGKDRSSTTDEHQNAVLTEEEDESLIDVTSLLPKPTPSYTLVLDDVLHLRVVGFPFGGQIAAFPISVAAILNAVSAENRAIDPRRPSELTVTLVQEPSIRDGRWGVEVRVTLRAIEVLPDDPLTAEDDLSQDEKSGEWRRVNVKDKMRKLKIRLMNAGKSKDEIEEEMRVSEEREEAEREAREAAIVRAGIGRGYEQGASMGDIVKRQMFYDPERIARRRVQRRATSGVDSAIIKAMSTGGEGLESEISACRLAAAYNADQGTDARSQPRGGEPNDRWVPTTPAKAISWRDATSDVSPISVEYYTGDKSFDAAVDNFKYSLPTLPSEQLDEFVSARERQSEEATAAENMSPTATLATLKQPDLGLGEFQSAYQFRSTGTDRDLSKEVTEDEAPEQSDSRTISQLRSTSQYRGGSQTAECNHPSPGLATASDPGDSKTATLSLLAALKDAPIGESGRFPGSVGGEDPLKSYPELSGLRSKGDLKSTYEVKEETSLQTEPQPKTSPECNEGAHSKATVELLLAEGLSGPARINFIGNAEQEAKSGQSGPADAKSCNTAELDAESSETASRLPSVSVVRFSVAHMVDTSSERVSGPLNTGCSQGAELKGASFKTAFQFPSIASDRNESAAIDSSESAEQDAANLEAASRLPSISNDRLRPPVSTPTGSDTKPKAANSQSPRITSAHSISPGAKLNKVNLPDATYLSMASQPLTMSSGPHTSEMKDMKLLQKRREMMQRAHSPSRGGVRQSLASSMTMTESQRHSLTSLPELDDFDSFIRRQRRERLRLQYEKEEEDARLALAARVMSSHPPLSSVRVRLSAIWNSKEAMSALSSELSKNLRDELPHDDTRGLSRYYIPWWIRRVGDSLNVIFLEEYPGLIFVFVLVGLVLLIR